MCLNVFTNSLYKNEFVKVKSRKICFVAVNKILNIKTKFKYLCWNFLEDLLFIAEYSFIIRIHILYTYTWIIFYIYIPCILSSYIMFIFLYHYILCLYFFPLYFIVIVYILSFSHIHIY